MEKTSIIIYGITVWEPVTLLTDLFVGLLSLIFYIKLQKYGKNTIHHIYLRNWRAFFLLFSVSTIMAGTAHGLFQYLGKYFLMSAWTLGLFSTFFLVNSSIYLIENKKLRRNLFLFVLIFSILSIILTFIYEKFYFVTVFSVIAVVRYL